MERDLGREWCSSTLGRSATVEHVRPRSAGKCVREERETEGTGQEARRRGGRIEKRGRGRESWSERGSRTKRTSKKRWRRIGRRRRRWWWREEQKRGRWEDRRCRGGREGIERVYSRQRVVGDVVAAAAAAAELTAEVDAYRGLFLVLRPVQSRRFACWPTDEITTTSKIAGDRRRVHRAKYDLECGNRVERRGGNEERKRENLLDTIPFITENGSGSGWRWVDFEG